MNIIKRKSDNVVIFKGDDLVLDKNGCRGKGWEYKADSADDLVMERVDELPEGFVAGMWEYSSGLWAETTASIKLKDIELSARIKDALSSIDALNDTLITLVIGRRDTEYLIAEHQAQEYIKSGYKGNSFPYVSSWAIAKNETDEWAADNIIETATAWREVQSDLRAKRLLHKENVRNSATLQDIDTVMASWQLYIKTLKQSLESY